MLRRLPPEIWHTLTVALVVSVPFGCAESDIREYRQHDIPITSIAFLSDAQRVAAADMSGGITVRELTSGEVVQTLEPANEDDVVFSLAATPDGRRVAAPSVFGEIVIWNLERGTVEDVLIEDDNAVTAVGISPDGRWMLSGGTDGALRKWDLEQREVSFVLEGHEGTIRRISFSPCGLYAATASYDRTARLWDVQNRKLLDTFEHEDRVTGVAYAPQGDAIVSRAGGMARLWSLEVGEVVQTFQMRDDRIVEVASAPDGRFIVSGTRYGALAVWDVNSGEKVAFTEATRYPETFSALAASPDGERAVAGTDGGKLIVWELSEVLPQ